MTKVLTLGTFDLLHEGHLRLLERCRKLGETVVALNSDEFVKAYKGRAPVQSYEARWAALQSQGIDVGPNTQGPDEPSARAVIEAVSPDLIVVGSDWRDRDYLGQLGVSQDWLDQRGSYVVYVPYTPGISTSLIRERLGV